MPSKCHRGGAWTGFERECATLDSCTVPSVLGFKNALPYYISAKQYYLSCGCKLENKALKCKGMQSNSRKELGVVVSRCPMTILLLQT